jgi:hypothetical protein
MWKKILTMSLMLAIVLSFTACAQEPSAQEIVDGVIESFDNIRTYQFDLVMTQDMVGEAEGEVLEQTVAVDNSGTLDLENLQMSAELSMVVNMLVPEEDEIEQRVEMYIIDGMMYAKPEDPDIEEPMWTKNELPAGAWEMMKGISGLETYMELLETAQVEIIGSEKVKGIDCYVIQLTPEIAQLWQTLGAGGFSGGVPGAPTIPEELIQEVFSDFTVKQWIAKDTYFLMKVEIDTVMELTSEFREYLGEEGEMSIDLTLNFLAYNYNQPVTIVLPPEAEGIEEMIEDRAPSWSPDGSRIAFTSERDGNDEIYVMDADGSNQQRLTNDPAEDWWSSWSPDGSRIAFVSNRDGNDEIYVIDANGSNQQRLTDNPAEDRSPSWSPDGSRITFTSDRDENYEIYVMDADGSNQQRLTDNPAQDWWSSWSPDGSRIAFVSKRDGNDEIYVMDVDGSNQQRLTDGPAVDGDAS